MLNPFYNTTNEGKENTSLTLSQEAFPQGQPYTISVASYSRFNNAVNTGNTTLKEFYWDSASGKVHFKSLNLQQCINVSFFIKQICSILL